MVCSRLSSVTSACDLGLVWVWFPCGGCLLPQSHRWLLDIIQLKPVWRNFRGDQEEIMAIHTEKLLRRPAFVARLCRGSKETLNNVVVAGKTVLISFGKRGIVNGCKDLTLAGELQTVFSCWEQPGLPRQASVCYLTQTEPVLVFLCHKRTELLLTEETAQKRSSQLKGILGQVCLDVFAKHHQISFSQGAQRNKVIIQDNDWSWLWTFQWRFLH